MNDKIEIVNNSVIQHGKYNDRIYLMKLHNENVEKTIDILLKLSKQNNYSKIFAKVPAKYKDVFLSYNFVNEAYIPGFCDGKDDIIFFSKYFSDERATIKDSQLVDNVLKTSINKEVIEESFFQDSPNIEVLTPNEAKEAADVYKLVFETYPFPIHKSEYLIETMKDNFQYFFIRRNSVFSKEEAKEEAKENAKENTKENTKESETEQKLNNTDTSYRKNNSKKNIIALSSCEIDFDYKNVEMTDFAVLPQDRGKKLAIYLLKYMEKVMVSKNIKTAFTIARAVSYGMNSTFAKLGYKWTGTLVNNTNISGNFESMNVWYKKI